MIYQRIMPQSTLQDFWRSIFRPDLMYDPAKQRLVGPFPSLPEHGLEFFAKGLVTSMNPRTGIVNKEPRVTIFGQTVSRRNYMMPSEEYLMIRVIFTWGLTLVAQRTYVQNASLKNYDGKAVK